MNEDPELNEILEQLLQAIADSDTDPRLRLWGCYYILKTSGVIDER